MGGSGGGRNSDLAARAGGGGLPGRHRQEPGLDGRVNRRWNGTQGDAILLAVMVSFMSRLDWTEGCPDGW